MAMATATVTWMVLLVLGQSVAWDEVFIAFGFPLICGDTP